MNTPTDWGFSTYRHTALTGASLHTDTTHRPGGVYIWTRSTDHGVYIWKHSTDWWLSTYGHEALTRVSTYRHTPLTGGLYILTRRLIGGYLHMDMQH